MAFIDDQTMPLETYGENCHEIEFTFTINNYHEIETLGYTQEYRLKCRTLKTEWSVWIIFQKQEPDIACIVNISRTDNKEKPLTASFNLITYNPTSNACKIIAQFPETEVTRNWTFKQIVKPVIGPEEEKLLDGDNLSVKFCLRVAGCH